MTTEGGESMQQMDGGQSVLITGASRGLGRSLALHLVDGGFRIFAGVRNQRAADELREASGGSLTPVMLDVTNDDHIQQAVETLQAELGDRGLWGLVNNAGIVDLGPVETLRMSDFREILEVNLFGAIAVTRACLPLVRRAGGRIVNVSSINGMLSMPFVGAYCASKFALEAASDALRAEVAAWGIRVSVIQPGVTASDIREAAMERWTERRSTMDAERAALYGKYYDATAGIVEGMKATAAPPDDFCASVSHALTADEPHTRYATGPDAPDFLAMADLPDRERDGALLAMWGEAG